MRGLYRLLCFVCLILPGTVSAQWEADRRLSIRDSAAYLNENMGICLAASGDSVHVFWWEHTTNGSAIWYKHSYDGGVTWGADTRITPSPSKADFPAVVVIGKSIHLVYRDSSVGTKTSYYKRSRDAGVTWDASIALGSYFEWPSVAARDSLVFVALNSIEGSGSEVYFRRSLDNGTTWDIVRRISNDPNRSEDPSIAVSGNSVTCGWNDKRTGVMHPWYRHSSDLGLTWDAETDMVSGSFSTYCPFIHANSASLDYIWSDSRNTVSPTTYFNHSNDSGATFTGAVQLPHSGTGFYPVMTRDGNNIHAVWGGSIATYYYRSTSGGTTWDTLELINNVNKPSFPFVAVGGSKVYVIWNDKRNGIPTVYFKRNPTGNPQPAVAPVDICKTDSIITPTRNFELLMGDSIVPVAAFRNVSSTPQSFYCLLRIRNARNGVTVDSSVDSVMNLAAGASQRIVFSKYVTQPQLDQEVGTMIVEAIARPFINGNHAIGDQVPGDDTLRTLMFVIKRLDNFSDFNNNFATPKLLPGNTPDVLKWVNINANVVDGDVSTFSPPPPLGIQGDPAGTQLHSPVIKLDRRDINGIEYDRCAATSGGAIGEGGVGDTLMSFPVNIANMLQCILAFSVERGGKKTYPRWYDATTATGPERTVIDSAGTVLRAGDSLVIDYADPSQIINVTKWKRAWSMDGGKDFNFKRVFVNIDSPYITQNFRFRVRLKAKNDFESGAPNDDNDEWFLDNILVMDGHVGAAHRVENGDSSGRADTVLKSSDASTIQENKRGAPPHTTKGSDVEVSDVRVGPNWPYVAVPASQATQIPIEVSVTNNGRIIGNAFGLSVTIRDITDPYGPVYWKLITIPTMRGDTSIVVNAPPWNGRQAGPGQYTISASLLPKGYDFQSQNDSTAVLFTLAFDSCFVYDNGVNDVPVMFQQSGLGLGTSEADPDSPLGQINPRDVQGTIATKFVLTERDTLRGAMIWFGGYEMEPDPIRISVYSSRGNVPGDTLAGANGRNFDLRGGPFDNFSRYAVSRFTASDEPVVLDPGEYWIGVSQLSNYPLQLGASAYHSSCDWARYDSHNSNNDSFVVNYPEMSKLFAYENSVGSGNWTPFYPQSSGRPEYGNFDSLSAYSQHSAVCDVQQKYFCAQGSWIPMLRPYFGTKSYGPRKYIEIQSGNGSLEFSATKLDLGTVGSCAGAGGGKLDSISIHCINAAHLSVTCTIAGSDPNDFRIMGDTVFTIAPDERRTIVISCRPSAVGSRQSILRIGTDYMGHSSDEIPLSAVGFVEGFGLSTSPYPIGDAPLGLRKCVDVPLRITGNVDDTITSITWGSADSGFTFAIPNGGVITSQTPETLSVCFAPRHTGPASATVVIKSTQCQRVDTMTFTANGVPSNSVSSNAVQPIAVLLQNRPNPFSDETEISFDLPVSGHARLAITDVLGRVCAVLVDLRFAAGHHSLMFNAKGLPAGNYLCTLETVSGLVHRVIAVAR